MAALGKITVITVVMNAVQSLEETIQSVLNCSRGNLEHIVIDGGSTDGTLEIIRKYANGLKCWLSEPDSGIYDAMNKGWHLADDDSWILFLGAGDSLISLPELLATPCQPYRVLYGEVEFAKNKVFYPKVGCRLKIFNSLHHQGLLVPKGIHPEPPFNVSYQYYADFDFNQRLYKDGASFEFKPSLRAFAAPDGITRDLQLGELLKIVKKNYGVFWWLISFTGFGLARCFPVLNRLRPIKSC